MDIELQARVSKDHEFNEMTQDKYILLFSEMLRSLMLYIDPELEAKFYKTVDSNGDSLFRLEVERKS